MLLDRNVRKLYMRYKLYFVYGFQNCKSGQESLSLKVAFGSLSTTIAVYAL